MKTCKYCDRPNSDNAEECKGCGAPLPKETYSYADRYYDIFGRCARAIQIDTYAATVTPRLVDGYCPICKKETVLIGGVTCQKCGRSI